MQKWVTTQRILTGATNSNENGTIEIVEQKLVSESGGYDQYRVYAKWLISGKSHTRRKLFRGETAWSDAQRMFDDISMSVIYGGSA